MQVVNLYCWVMGTFTVQTPLMPYNTRQEFTVLKVCLLPTYAHFSSVLNINYLEIG
jgi:hypothetical protein